MEDNTNPEDIRLISFRCSKFDSDALMFRSNILDVDKSELFRFLVRQNIEKNEEK